MMIEISNARLVANLLGTRSRPASGTDLSDRFRRHTDSSRRINNGASSPGEANRRPVVVVHLSPQAIRASRGSLPGTGEGRPPTNEHGGGKAQAGEPTGQGAASTRNSTAEAPQAPDTQQTQQTIDELERRDREVRHHEATHKAALGRFAKGGPRFSFTTGPDGRRYAVSGEVSVDLSPVPGDPEATLQKMATVRRAALAPTNPSAADRAIAAEATRKMAAARRELMEERLARQEEVSSASAAVASTDIARATSHEIEPTRTPPHHLFEPPLGAPVDWRGRLVDIQV
jgi:hypothetical protein